MQPTVTANTSSKRELGGVAGLRLLNSQKVAYIPGHCGRTITVGRTRQRDIRVRHPTVSRLHCLIDITVDLRYIITDATDKISNKLQVAERGHYSPFRSVAWHVLEVGNYLRLGEVVFVVVDADGHCPIVAASADELLRYGVEIYGSKRKVRELFNLSKTWCDHATRNGR